MRLVLVGGHRRHARVGAGTCGRPRADRTSDPELDELVLPPIFPVEVGGALARSASRKRAPHEVVTMGPKRAAAAQTLAMNARLRGDDAVYVWLAAARVVTLCTLDDEMTTRGGAFCRVIPP